MGSRAGLRRWPCRQALRFVRRFGSDPAVHARLPKVQRDESRTLGLDRLEMIRFLQIAQTITVHHGALAYLLGTNALRASEAAAVGIEDQADILRGYRWVRSICRRSGLCGDDGCRRRAFLCPSDRGPASDPGCPA